jgi:hypothetical protein
VALVNQSMAARYWPGQNAVGKRIRLVSRDGQVWAEVVGVTADSKYNFIGEAPTPWMYLAQQQDPGFRATLIIASEGDAAALASPLRAPFVSWIRRCRSRACGRSRSFIAAMPPAS